MKRFRIIEALHVLTAGLLFSGLAYFGQPAPPSSTVKVLGLDGSHGSAVHVGNGLYITAAHVLQHWSQVEIKNDQGEQITALVGMKRDDYDVAALWVPDPDFVSASPLNCLSLTKGEQVRVEGNPMKLEFVEFDVKVVGKPVEYAMWNLVYPVTPMIVPGMSGGGAFDQNGDVRGISVGVIKVDVSLGNIGFVVPSSVVCDFLNGKLEPPPPPYVPDDMSTLRFAQ